MKLATMFNTSSALSASVGLMLCAHASAGTFSVSGPGASLVDGVGVYPGVLPTPSTSSTVVINRPVTSITTVTITGLTHTWAGDLQFVLKSPSGTRTTVFCRPGLTSSTSFGNSSDFLGGTYTFMSPPGTMLPIAGNPPPGTYVPNFGGTGTGAWPDGPVVFNTNFSAVSGAGGTWTLESYDWGAGDVGSYTGWTLTGTDSGINAFCYGDGTGTPCPCSFQSGQAGRGCKNSKPGNPGCLLTAVNAVGGPNPSISVTTNDLGLKSEGMLSGSYCIFFQGTAAVNGGFGFVSPSYDGLECVGGTLIRLGRITTMGGTNTLHGVASQAGLAASAQTLFYQTVYRNKAVFCTPATLNTSNGLQICWTP